MNHQIDSEVYAHATKSNPLHELLSIYRSKARDQREKGTYFELLIKDFLKNDPTYSPQFSDVWTYAEWATLNESHKNDKGIDLVAKLKDEEGYCAIQCKFYEQDHKIYMKDLETFFMVSGKKYFKRRLLVDTTKSAWSSNAEDAIREQTIEVQRIGLTELENSPIDWSVYTPNKPVKIKAKKELFPHQSKALQKVKEGLESADRGKLI